MSYIINKGINNNMREAEQEGTMEDDMAELAQELSHSNFNVKHFKRMRAAKPVRLSNQRNLSRIYTEHTDSNLDATGGSLHSKTVGQGLNKTFRYVDTHIPPKKQPKFFSKPQVKSADRFLEVPSRKKMLVEKASQLQKYEREWSKGKMKERCIEEWLNAILVQYCHDEYFDKSIANSALKKLGIDENSLVAKGMPHENVSRLYRGLFVFGMGFNSLIGELTKGNMEVLKTVWRIYSIILEYCSKGGMVTVIGEIERESSGKVAVLMSEIVRKQQIIEKNQELNEQKNAQIFREIKKLREQNVNLINQKTVLVEEYNSTEQAFSEEVSLRLKFETKINQIYGLHRQLGIKHQRLFQDFSSKVEELRICADRYFESTIKSQQSKESQYKLREELVLLRLSNKKQTEYVDELVRERIQLLSKASKLEYMEMELRTELAELKHREQRWMNVKINMEATIDFRQKSAKETHTEYQFTLEENNRLYILLSDQRKIMEEYEKEKKNFNSKVISIVSENSYHKRKMEEANRKCEALQETCKQLTAKYEQSTLELEVKTSSEQSYQTFFNSSEENLVEMRRINIAHEEELAFLRKYHYNMERVLKQKNDWLEQISQKHHKTLNQTQRATIELQQLKSKYSILEQQKRMSDEGYIIKQAKLNIIEEQLCLKRDQLEKARINFTLEQERLKTHLDQSLINYKNEKFERATLNSSYIQTLKIVEKKNVTERDLNVKISMMEGEIEKEKTRYSVMQKNMKGSLAKMGKELEKMESTLQLQRAIIVKKQQYKDPMLVEDLYAALHRQFQRNTSIKAQIKTLQIQLQKAKKFCQQEVERLSQEHRWNVSVLTKQAEHKLELLTNELAFQKKGNAELRERVKQYEILAESYRKKISQRETSQREQVYLKAIEQKKKDAEEMFKQMEKLQDQLLESKRLNAQLNLRQGAPSESGEESQRGRMETLRKQLQHEYSLKFRELQRQMKQELARKEQQAKQEHQAMIRGMSIEDILRVKEMKPNELMKELSITHKTDKFRQLSAQHSVEANRESFLKRQTMRANEDIKNRRQINRLIKRAYDYYN